jgi:hypothetical protein
MAEGAVGTSIWLTLAGGILPSDASCLGQKMSRSFREYQQGCKACKTIQLAGISVFIIIIMIYYSWYLTFHGARPQSSRPYTQIVGELFITLFYFTLLYFTLLYSSLLYFTLYCIPPSGGEEGHFVCWRIGTLFQWVQSLCREVQVAQEPCQDSRIRGGPPPGLYSKASMLHCRSPWIINFEL